MRERELEEISRRVRALLLARPEGYTEYELLRELADLLADPVRGYGPPLVLFRAHFVLFHCLYRMRPGLLAEGLGSLEIGPLAIRLRPAADGAGRALGGRDALAAYYLDLSELERVDAAALQELLSGFGRRLQAREARSSALAALGLDTGADGRAIERRYRHLVSRHHPDRGGDTARLQEINRAMAVLRQA